MDPEIKSKLDSLEEKINDLDDKLSDILILLERDIKPNCNKMSGHIDFVDNVYDNVKNPLGFICSRVSKLSSSNNYNLTDK
tara:strand:+ start:1482 stop:1724 length:243 start_codon:yes stop_codon:yes gene_type:complete